MRALGRSGIRRTWRSWRQGIWVQGVEVVRDLAGREASSGLSAGEKRMLAKARLILLQEG
jgi:RNA polymerase-interacting CarD/CdnL/TRCF family regulator